MPIEGTNRLKCKYCQFELDEERSAKIVIRKHRNKMKVHLASHVLGEDFDFSQ